MTPNQEQKFREQKMTVLNHEARYCQSCKRRRSIRQFAGESVFCKQCVLRGAK